MPVLSIEKSRKYAQRFLIFLIFFVHIDEWQRFTALPLYHAKAGYAFVNMHKPRVCFGTLFVQNDESGRPWFFSSTK
jgi:hypothetical protein